VRALADGVVISAEWSINYGNTIQIQHGDGYISIIKHCSSLLKKEGDVVLRGDGIGVLGLSGVINTGPHVHIELWRNGVALDPELYLITN
jgi:murein DD-endopeptidase MepM/ murein hydrolase activator NlpD